MKKSVKIRPAKPQDIEIIVELCNAHSEFEQVKYNTFGKSEKLENALFSESPKLNCILAEIDGQVVGYVTYMKQFSTWEAEEYVYLDCLFLIEKARNMGIGELLMSKIQERAEELGCTLIQWQTPIFNKRAINFYKRIGAYSKSKERFFLPI